MTSVTIWQWAAQGQAGFVARSSGVDPWLSPGRATWSLPRRVERRLLSRLASGWENRAISVAGGGAGSRSFIVACQVVMEPRERGIRRREWSSAATVTAACQGVMEPRGHGIRRREWSSVATVTAACQRVMELRGIRRRK